jgi:ERF superfamily
MPCSSRSIASLAAALAKAQADLVNPEKSMVATIRPDGPGGAARVFRYAPLASGLDIVRKTLGQHEIAILQTTAIDPAAGMVNLTTMLAHASGEWISSDWPVCAVSDTATPHRMGAALTYARRYALFALVGIAGDDDLDAPDLIMAADSPPTAPDLTSGEGQRRDPAPHRQANAPSPRSSPPLTTAASAILRDQLLGQVSALGCSDEAALWAQRMLPTKNGLTAPDAEQVEEAFRARLTTFDPVAPSAEESSAAPAARGRAPVIDKSRLALPEPRRLRDRDHVRALTKLPCLICGRCPSDPHHLRFVQPHSLGRRVSDEFTVPLCLGHHREVHRCGDEAAWWRHRGIDPTVAARTLWLETHPLRTEPRDFLGQRS